MRNIKALIGIVCLIFASAVFAQAGRDYVPLSTPQPTEGAAKVEVIEFFSYMCPHCAHFDPVLVKWLKGVPKDVVFRRVPVIFRPQWEAPAKLYFTLEAMNELDRLHGAAFDAIHGQGAMLITDAAVADWAAKMGLDRKKFADVYGSFTVQSKAMRAKQASGAYGISGVPAMVVGGKYRTADNPNASQEDILKVVDALIVKVRGEQGRK